jgi:RimJ/RimL family protein N-acetyltransferase
LGGVYIVREAIKEKDFEEVLGIGRLSFEKPFLRFRDENLDSIESHRRSGFRLFLIQERPSKRSIGTFRVKISGDGYAEVHRTAFLPERRSFSLFFAVWKEFLIPFCKLNGVTILRTSTFRYNHRLIALLKKVGFENVALSRSPGGFYEEVILEFGVPRA